MCDFKYTIEDSDMHKETSFSLNYNFNNELTRSKCNGCALRDKEIEELKRKLKTVTEDRNNQIKLNNNLLRENIEAEKQQRSDQITPKILARYNELNAVVEENGLVELLPKSGVFCSPVTLETAKAQQDVGHAICYLFKRLFTMDELAESTLGAHSKNGFKQLPSKIVQGLKAFIICTFTQKDGQKVGVTLLNHTINSLCGQARILKKRGKVWKIRAEKEE